MSDLDVEATTARYEAACTEVSDLCSGEHKWRMRIPADPNRDSDLLISASLGDVPSLLSALEERDAKIAELEEACESHGMLHAFATGQIDGLREQIADLRSALEPFAVENGDEQERTAWRVLRYLEDKS